MNESLRKKTNGMDGIDADASPRSASAPPAAVDGVAEMSPGTRDGPDTDAGLIISTAGMARVEATLGSSDDVPLRSAGAAMQPFHGHELLVSILTETAPESKQRRTASAD